MLKYICLVIVLFVLSACGGSRQMGDLDGLPVEFEIILEKEFVAAMENRQGQVGASVGTSVGSGGASTGIGFGLSFQSTNVYLYGGNSAGQANVFRKKLSWGENRFEIPMRVGREVVLTAVVSGGRSGWEAVGNYKVKATDNAIRLQLTEAGAQIQTSDSN